MSRTLSGAVLFAALCLSALPARAADSPDAIRKDTGDLRSLSDDARGPKTGELAHRIAAMPAGLDKIKLAYSLAGLATEGDPGRDNMQAVADTLAQALLETPQPSKTGAIVAPYLKLAQLERFEAARIPTAMAAEPEYKKAVERLAANDADIAKADFTLRDTNGKKWTLSELHGKVVMVNFWATWCPPCRAEIPQMDAIAAHFSNDLVLLSVTDEDLSKVYGMFRGSLPHYNILLDPGGKAHKDFHISGIPATFVFNREGKLTAEALDRRTQKQFLLMLRKSGLQVQ